MIEITSEMREAISLALLEIEKTVQSDLKRNISLRIDAYAVFKKQNFINFAISFIKSNNDGLFALDYYMPVLLWDIGREETIIMQKGRNEECKVDYKSAFSGTISEKVNSDNIIFEKTLIYPAHSIT